MDRHLLWFVHVVCGIKISTEYNKMQPKHYIIHVLGCVYFGTKYIISVQGYFDNQNKSTLILPYRISHNCKINII